jgi:hypothetical protein
MRIQIKKFAPALFLALAVIVPIRVHASNVSIRVDKPQPQIAGRMGMLTRPFRSTVAIVQDAATFKDRESSTLLMIQTGFLVSDGITTARDIAGGEQEVDPLARLVLGSRPSWNRMIPIGAGVALGSYWIGSKMHHSQNRLLRRLWYVPQVAGILGNAYGTVHNIHSR